MTQPILNRARGALIGLAVGDAVGTTIEFKPRDSYNHLTDMVGGGPFDLQPGQWTDDTSMALALADSLIEKGGLDEADLMTRFVNWRDAGAYSCTGTCFDIGITVSTALSDWLRSGNPIAGSTDPYSAGNGSLMRLSPVAIRYWNDDAARSDAAARQSRTTHGADEAVDACIAYADLIAAAIAGEVRDTLLARRHEGLNPKTAAIMAGSWRSKERDDIGSSGYVSHSLEAALWSLGRTDTYADAVLLAANLGEDADTTAAITGQLAGAIYGVDAIPRAWLDKLAWRVDIEKMADTLFDTAR